MSETRPPSHVSSVSELYINRELSWLDFNARVLEEAQDERQPPVRARQVHGHRRQQLR